MNLSLCEMQDFMPGFNKFLSAQCRETAAVGCPQKGIATIQCLFSWNVLETLDFERLKAFKEILAIALKKLFNLLCSK